MAEVEIANIMREFVGLMGKGDTEKMLSYLTDDVDWLMPSGKVKGKDEIRRLLSSEAMRNGVVTECGNGIIVDGNKAFFEHMLESNYRGRKARFLAICAYEFKDDKIQHMRTTFDRLSVAQQVTSGLPQMIVNQVVKQSEKMTR